MIARLTGRILSKDSTGAVIDCHGVGYGVFMSLSSLTKLGPEGSEARLYVHTHVGQDMLRLFGFIDAEERAFFEILIATTGVGPRLALSILSTMTPSALSLAVASGDKGLLTQIPGIGNKTAERLLVELKGRLPERTTTDSVTPTSRGLMGDLVSALVNLGFKLAIAEAVARETLAAAPAEQDLATLVRDALRASSR